MKPQSVNIFSKEYEIIYCDKTSDVDSEGRKALWGQLDSWTHTIRICAPDGFSDGEIWDSLIHEIIHAIKKDLKLNDEEEKTGLLAMGLADVLLRNGWLKDA